MGLTIYTPDEEISPISIAWRIGLIVSLSILAGKSTHPIHGTIVQLESSHTFRVPNRSIAVIPKQDLPCCSDVACEERSMQGGIARLVVLQIHRDMGVAHEHEEERPCLLSR